MNGFLNVLKPPGMSSSDVVVHLRRILGIKKIGHTGTLDPDAAGVLVVAVGKATRTIEYAGEADKGYRCGLILGYITDTDDLEGNIIYAHPGPLPSVDELNGVLDGFVGRIQQIPPAYSAMKVDGRRAYSLAREGAEVQISPREVTVYSIKILRQTGEGRYDIDIRCGKGVYIRSLCRDIGHALGCGGTMEYLVRTFNGPFAIGGSLTLEEIGQKAREGSLKCLPMEKTLAYLPAITWPEHLWNQALSGRALPLDQALDRIDQKALPEGDIRIYCGGSFVGIGAVRWAETGWEVRFKKMLAD